MGINIEDMVFYMWTNFLLLEMTEIHLFFNQNLMQKKMSVLLVTIGSRLY